LITKTRHARTTCTNTDKQKRHIIPHDAKRNITITAQSYRMEAAEQKPRMTSCYNGFG